MRIDAGGATDVDVDEEKLSWYWVKMALLAPQTYLSAFIWFFLLVPLYVSFVIYYNFEGGFLGRYACGADDVYQSFSLFLPSIIAGMGYQSTTAQLFTVPPNMAAFLTVIGTAYASDRLKNRGYFIIGGSVLGICGYVMLIVATTNAVRYAGTFLVAIGVFQGSPMLMVSLVTSLSISNALIENKGWASNNLAPHYVRAVGIGIIISIANCSAFIGTFIYLQRDAPRYTLGHSISLGALVITIFLAAAQCAYLSWENKNREQSQRDGRLLQSDAGRLGHRHPNFRFTL